VIGLSVDPVDKHENWAQDIEETQATRPTPDDRGRRLQRLKSTEC
jgi:alkyl hydroperoxide reductase subunit AhpC